MASTPILDLNTLIDRPQISIDGKMYEMYSADELSILDAAWFSKLGDTLQKAAAEGDQELVEETVTAVAKRCLVNVPDAIFDKLSGSQKMAITELFTRLLLQRKMRVAGAIARTVLARQADAGATGETSSPASSGSTAATRTGGSGKRRRPS